MNANIVAIRSDDDTNDSPSSTLALSVTSYRNIAILWFSYTVSHMVASQTYTHFTFMCFRNGVKVSWLLAGLLQSCRWWCYTGTKLVSLCLPAWSLVLPHANTLKHIELKEAIHIFATDIK